MTLTTALHDLTEAHLQRLIDDQIPESKTLEYKESLPDDTREQRKEFLADVSAFANAAGGYLLFGIREADGVAAALPGLVGITNVDNTIQRLENMLRNGVEPRIPGLGIRAVPLAAGTVVIALHIPRSWMAPHVAKNQQHWRFYGRNANGKYPLDVGELRALVLGSESLTERIRQFRAERISAIAADVTPVPMVPGARLVLHVIPVQSFHAHTAYAMPDREALHDHLFPIGNAPNHTRYNLDGLLSCSRDDQNQAQTYVQLFRNGCLEAVDTTQLPVREDQGVIPIWSFENELIAALTRYGQVYDQLGLSPPYVVVLSLLGVTGYMLRTDAAPMGPVHPIDRDHLLLPELVIEEVAYDPATVLRPLFDAVWNAAGLPGSRYYNQAGERIR